MAKNMARGPNFSVFLRLLFVSLMGLALAWTVISDGSMGAKISGKNEYGCNYHLHCKMVRLGTNGSLVQTIPKLMTSSPVIGGWICRIPYCMGNICNNGSCEETMTGYECHCFTGFHGRHCDERNKDSTELSALYSTTKPTVSLTTTMSDSTTHEETTNAAACQFPLLERHGGSCYYFSTDRKNHDSAVSACSECGSHLVYIESEEEQDFIVRHVQETNKDYWIGLNGTSENTATWLDGSSPSYTFYSNRDQFNDGGACFRIRQRDNSWADYSCSSSIPYICEKD